MKTLLFAALLLLPSHLDAQTVGCVNGSLQNPQAWFYNHIGRQPGQNAADWSGVLTNSGLLAGPLPGVLPGPANYGITQQIGAAGPRGRIFLPTTSPDSGGYYTREVDVLADGPTSGSLVWAWRENTSQPPYAARPCDGGGTIPPPVSDLEKQVKILTLQVQELQKTTDSQGDAINNLDIAFKDVNARLRYVEAHLPSGCAVGLFGLRASCNLTGMPNPGFPAPGGLTAPAGAQPETPKAQLERQRSVP